MRLIPLALWLGPLLPAQATRPTADPAPGSRPTTASRPALPPVSGSAAALALARRVHERAGGYAALQQLQNIVFTVGGTRRMLWSLADQKVRVETLQGPPAQRTFGVHWDVLVYDCAGDRSLLRFPPKPAPQAPEISAKSMFYEDTFALLAPLKLLDPGTKLSIDPPEDADAKGVRRLRVAFDKVPILGESQYVLHVDAETGKVARWDLLTRPTAKLQAWSWEAWAQVGTLNLALRHAPLEVNARRTRAVEFSDVATNVEPPADVWTSREKVLAGLK